MARAILPEWVEQAQGDAIFLAYAHHKGREERTRRRPLRQLAQRMLAFQPEGAQPENVSIGDAMGVVAQASSCWPNYSRAVENALDDFHARGERRMIQFGYVLPIVGKCDSCRETIDAAGIPTLDGDFARSQGHASFDRMVDKFPEGAQRDQFLRKVQGWCDNATDTTLSINGDGLSRCEQHSTAYERRPPA